METQTNQKPLAALDCIRDGFELLKNNYSGAILAFFFATLIAGFGPLLILQGPMFCGIFLWLAAKREDKPVAVSTIFDGFKFFGKSLVATWLHFALALAAVLAGALFVGLAFGIVVFFFPLHGGMDYSASYHDFWWELERDFRDYFPPIFLGMVAGICGAGIIYFMSHFIFTYPLIVEKNLEPQEALRESYRGFKTQKWGLIRLVCLNFLFSILSSVCLGIGAIFYAPAAFASLYVAYRKIYA